VIPLGTSGSILFIDANGKLAEDNSNFFWNDTLDRLIINELELTPGANDYLLTSCGGNCLTFQSQTAGAVSHLRIMSFDGDGTDNVFMSIHGVGTPTDVANRERLILGWDETNTDYHIVTEAAGTGTVRALHIGTGANHDQFILNTDGTSTFGGNVSFGDNNITNVGDISLDRILSDAGTTITVVLGTDAGDDLIVGNNNAFVVEGDTDYIGIGILAPIGRFQVAQSGTFPSGANTAIFDNAQSQTDFNFSYANALFMNSNATTNNWAKFTFTGNADGTNGSGGIGFQFTDRVNNYGNWGFYTNAADGFLDRFHIKSDGCIGINQSLPTAMLHIVPNATTVEGIFIKAPGLYNADFLSLQDSLGNELITFTAGGGAVFNENGNDADFRIEGDTDANLFILDAGLDLIGLGRVPTTYLLEVGRDQNAATIIQTINANAVDTGATSGFFALASTANLIALAHGDGRTTTRYGVTIGGYAELVTTAGEGLLIGTGALNKPIIFGTNDVERWRILGGGGLQSNAAEKLLFRDSAIGIYSQADTYMDFFADGGMRFGDSSAGAPTNYTQIASNGDFSQTGTARRNWTKWTANNITVTTGGGVGTVSDLQTAHDGNVYHVDEVAGGLELRVEFINVTAFNRCHILASYVGSSTHGLHIDIYNFNTTSWDTVNAMDDHAVVTQLEDYGFPIFDDTNYIGTGGDLGDVRVRFYHPMGGNAAHDLEVDVVALYQ
jgi:hypothetical protein